MWPPRCPPAQPASRWRMEVAERADGVTVINDAYNANPESVRAALEALVGLAAGRRTWAVLGEMRELGDGAARAARVGGRISRRASASTDCVVVGDGGSPDADAARPLTAPGPRRPCVVADVRRRGRAAATRGLRRATSCW